jgi:hypothetical protein
VEMQKSVEECEKKGDRGHKERKKQIPHTARQNRERVRDDIVSHH